jgi:hypothetical protein
MFAFYLFDEDEFMWIKGNTRLTEATKQLKNAENAGNEEEINRQRDELDIQYLRYARR